MNKSLINLFHDGTLAVGIKGLPGRGGIGAGHSLGFMVNNDSNFVALKSIIGEDAEKYRNYYVGRPVPTGVNMQEPVQNLQYTRTNRYPLFRKRRY